jgi:putative DNA primase/helicase
MHDLDRIREALQFIPVGAHDERVRVAFMIKSELGDLGRDLWDEWRDGRGDDEAASVWKSASETGTLKIGTLFHEAKANGWRDDGTYQRPTPEEINEQRRIAAERAAKEEAETGRQRADTAAKAAAIYKAATEAKADQPYLSHKQVSPVATLREIDAGAAAEILGYAPKSRGELLTGRLLVVPVEQGDGLSTLELIDGDRRKTALAGRGTKTGGYWATERLPDGDGDGLTLLIGEGVATVLSASVATGHLAIAALSSGNMPVVAKAMREHYPAAVLVILADLVKETGEVDHHAIEAARSVGGKIAVPEFGTNRAPGMTDFNDMAVTIGKDAVRRTIQSASAAGRLWPEPQPLTASHAPEPYPLDALPNTVRAAVEEVAGFVKAPLPMVASSALAALSLAIQAHVDIKRAEKLHGPTGLFLLTIADSGERKSTCDGFFTKAIRDYEAEQAEAAKPVLKRYKADIEAWEAKRSGIKDKIRHLAKDSKPTDGMEAALRELEQDKPEPPRVPRLMYADATPEALAHGLAKQWPSGGVVSAEAGIVFGSHGMGKDSVMRNLATLNQLWDGTSLTIDRRTSESFTVQGARLTVALQVQEPTLREFFSKSGALARGTGFLARFLVSWPASTQGYRPFTEAPANWPALAAFNHRLAEILGQPVPMDDDGALTPAMLSLSPEAKRAWVEYHDAIESELANGGELYDVRDVASKSADNAARLAALFQMFEHGTGAVSVDCFESASRITAWHLNEARRFFGELALPAELADAARLDSWLMEYCRRERVGTVNKRYLRQHGPVRDGARLDSAIMELIELDRLRLRNEGRRIDLAVNRALLEVGA